MRNLLLVFFAVIVSATAYAEEEHIAPITAKMPQIKESILKDVLFETINAANEKRGDPSQDEIDKMEETWKGELDSENFVLIASVVSNPLADHLRSVVEGSDGLITEINVMDAKGFSVGQSSPNSDIWQGEEIKYTKTFLVGPDAIFIDEVEEDVSTQSFQSQANFTVKDSSGKPIGAVSVGIDVGILLDY